MSHPVGTYGKGCWAPPVPWPPRALRQLSEPTGDRCWECGAFTNATYRVACGVTGDLCRHTVRLCSPHCVGELISEAMVAGYTMGFEPDRFALTGA